MFTIMALCEVYIANVLCTHHIPILAARFGFNVSKALAVLGIPTNNKLKLYKNNGLNKTMSNGGEKAEISAVRFLYKCSDAGSAHASNLVLKSIFGPKAEGGIVILNPQNMEPYQSEAEIGKTGAGFKADVIVQFKKTKHCFKYSIKSYVGAPPHIIESHRSQRKGISTRG